MQENTVRIKEDSLLAKIAAWKLGADSCAVAFGSTIYLHKATKQELREDTRWYKHEVAHLQQCKRLGTIRFLFLYIWFSVKYGYQNNPLEIEAREAENKE